MQMFRPKKSVNLLRYLLALLGSLFLVQTVDLGIASWCVSLFLVLGIYSSNTFLKKGISFKTTLAVHVGLFIIYKLLFWVLSASTGALDSSYFDLHTDIFNSRVQFLAAIYAIVFIENHLFWTKRFTLSFEVLGIGLILLSLLSGHRNYKIDMPNAISSLTWKLPMLQRLGAEPQQLLVGIAFVFGILSMAYIILANDRMLYGQLDRINRSGKRRRLLELVVAVAVITGLFYSSKIILSRYETELSQVMNGVGPSNDIKNGQSNLGFNKASNPSRQPAAFVRLQNSYDENPWKPMMYFREGALSDYNGKEIVKSGVGYDTDAPILRPGEPYRSEILDGKDNRTKLLQAVYVLSDKTTPFGIDAPTQFNPIKNPNPKRFRYAYTVLSFALTEPLSDLTSFEVGNPNWTKDQWDHYLRAPASKDLLEGNIALPELGIQEPVLASGSGEDLRYKALSEKLTLGVSNPVEKAVKIIEYLSKESIYVLEPGHTLGSNGDPVAPYLFPEKKRGYCVHFAHAATYLLRLAGIPARIGTGFLVDLQYAKGGDILVQMGDRHAWSEIYVQDRGWVVFDVTPAQAESKEVPVPDESLLEQLMSEIDPIEELGLPDPIPEKELDQKSPIEALLDSPIWAYQKYVFAFAFVIFLFLKIALRHLWRFTSDPRLKLRRAYLSLASTYEDIGIKRNYGETRLDFANRLLQSKNINFVNLSKAAIETSFTKSNAPQINLKNEMTKALLFSKEKPWKAFVSILSYLNPASLPLAKKLFTKSGLKSLLIVGSLASILHSHIAFAIPGNESFQLDPNLNLEEQAATTDLNKTSDELLIEAIELMRDGKTIDARAKLEYALNKNPKDHRPYLFLGQYYLSEVGHFKLAYRYLKQARKLFEENNMQNLDSIYDLGFQNQHALILYLESEAALNLDFYQESLDILDEYSKRYQAEWFPGQKAWVLMKLKRIDEAIDVARSGLVEGADPKRTWNILGILLSVSNQRELSLQAFGKAIKYELNLSGTPQVATPLNNAGEVYRELFRDEFAESAWQKALTLPDGCDHILPSVNLSILYTDQLRLFQAEQILSDFEACYALKPERKDSEHRTILALARSKIKLLANDLDAARQLGVIAADDQQWFGKIGTNENDVKFASWATLAITEKMSANALRDKVNGSTIENMQDFFAAKRSEINSWWLNRKAKIFAVTNLDDFEDLFIRHTDTMITYPMLGEVLSQLDYTSLKRRLDRLRSSDQRPGAKNYYDFYEAKKLASDGSYDKAIEILDEILNVLPEHERLLKAEVLATLLNAKLGKGFFFQRTRLIKENSEKILELYRMLPSYLRLYDLPLPVTIETDSRLSGAFKDIKDDLTKKRFLNSASENTDYRLAITKGDKENTFVQLYEKSSNRRIAEVEIQNKKEIPQKLNEFIKLSFSHRSDPKGMTLPEVPLFK